MMFMKAGFSDRIFINSSVFLWLVFIVIVSVIVSQQGMSHTVTPSYFFGADLWMQGKDLYDGSGRGFIYLPQSAVLFVPFAYLAKLSFSVAEVTWRIISLLLLVFALWRFAKLVEPKLIARAFFIITITTVPLVFSSARNGQFNTILEVMMLLAVCAVAKEKWCYATFYLVLGLALKPTMVVLLLLLWALYRPLWWRLPIGLLAIFIFPFFTQTPIYVWHQYVNSTAMLKTASALGATTTDWAQFFGLLAEFKIIISQRLQDFIRIIAALFILYCGVRAQKKFNKYQVAIFLYTLASCYLMLFNPRTENNDYGIVAPALGLFITVFFVHSYILMLLLVFVFLGLVMSGNLSFNGSREFWSAPFFTVIFTVIVVAQIFYSKMRNTIFKTE